MTMPTPNEPEPMDPIGHYDDLITEGIETGDKLALLSALCESHSNLHRDARVAMTDEGWRAFAAMLHEAKAAIESMKRHAEAILDAYRASKRDGR